MNEPSQALNAPIATLELPIRLERALYMAGHHTVGDVVGLRPNQITRMNNVGVRSLNQLRSSLKSRGLSLKGDRIEETTPPQDGAPVTEDHGGSVAQCVILSRRYTRILPVYAILRESETGPVWVWEIKGRDLLDRRFPPRCIDQFIKANEGFFATGHLHVGIYMRSFFGLVDQFIPVSSIALELPFTVTTTNIKSALFD